jgi:alpha-N-arabinofuranosidase
MDKAVSASTACLQLLARGGMALALLFASPASAGPARFAWLDYRGSDGPAAPAGHYRNPILAGYYPDPSVVRVGGDYYLVNSTFSWFPGIPVFHSRDLVHWRQIGNAIDRPGQLDFGKLGMSRGVFAASISYHDGTFFIVNTCVDCGGNFVITARDPAGPWSDPAWLKTVDGIDPSLFFDTDGRAWLVSNGNPAGPERYQGHRAIWLQEFDPKGLKLLGTPRVIVDSGVDPASKPVWIEGPHLYRHKGAYYLMAAEGGTSVNHSEVIFKAASIEGPYVPAPSDVNPILTQRDLSPKRPNPISATGHADLIALPDGRWWSVFLGTRPYAQDFYNTGRETFALPVDWSGDWPVILPHGKAVPRMPEQPLPSADAAAPPTTGSFSVRDEFDRPKLGLEWMTMRAAPPYQLDKGELVLTPGDGLGDFGHPAFVARRLQHRDAVVTTEMRFTPGDGEAAGLAALQNDEFFLTIALTRGASGPEIRVARRAGAKDPADGVTVAERPIAASGPIRLRISFRGGVCDFAYATGKQWIVVARGVDATNLSTAKAGGFVGTMVGPFAEGLRQP